MAKVCGICKEQISASSDTLLSSFDYVKCNSVCGRIFHIKCVNLLPDHIKLLTNNPNFLWRCDACIVVSNDTDSKIEILSQQVREMQNKFLALEHKFDDYKEVKEKSKNSKPKQKHKPVLDPPVAPSAASSTVDECEQFVDAINDNVNNEECDNAWVTVRKERKRKPKQNKRNIYGRDAACNEFDVIHRLKYLHVSKFKNTTESEAIIKFVAGKLDVDSKLFSCYKLVKKDADITQLHFVNFKLGVPESLFNRVFNKDFWPFSVKLSHFIHKAKNINAVDDVINAEIQETLITA